MSSPQKNNKTATTPADSPSKEEPKSLNVNAKSFVPKMESAKLEQPASPAKAGGSPPQAATTPNQLPGQIPVMAGQPPPLGMPPPPPGFPMMMPPMMPGMPVPGSPMLINPALNPAAAGFAAPPGFQPNPMMVPGAAAMRPGVPVAPGTPTQLPPTGAVPPSPTVVPRVPMAPGFVTSAPVAPAVPTPTAGANPTAPAVHVGNATLQAKRSTVPPKFGCVLLAGVTGVGKSSAGRALVDELSEDKLGWQFFSGADYLRDAPTAKPAVWDVTKSVFDGLSEFLDELLARQAAKPIRGLLIDKQLRGVEDLYYLTQLLRSKGLLLWGVIGMDCPSDETLCSRLGNSPGLVEKIKFHRVIYSRIQEASKLIGIWRTVDGNGTLNDTIKNLRTMVLGCSSQSPTKQFNASLYHDSPIPMVDNYATYAAVMSALFTVIPRNAKGAANFPGFTGYTPLGHGQLDAKKQPLKEYAVRRKVDGTKYVLFFDGNKLFLIPRHMRCVFEMTSDAWLGVHLSNTGRFVVDGDLVKTTKERSKEKFVVSDVIFWAEKGSVTNLVLRATWKERQERLKTNLCSEQTAFFPKKGDLVVVHQTVHEDHKELAALLEPTDYPCDGLVFHPTSHRRDEPTYIWRPVEELTADFRLGAFTAKEEAPSTRVFEIEVFDQKQVKYSRYREDVVEIAGVRATAVEGAIVSCRIDPLPSGGFGWAFQRVRTDLSLPAFKTQIDDLLKDCVVAKLSLLEYVSALETKAGGAKQPMLGGEKQPDAPAPGAGTAAVPAASSSAAAPAASSGKSASRQVFGSALSGPDGTPPDQPPQQQSPPSMRDVVTGEHKNNAAKNTKPAPKETNDTEEGLVTDAQKLASIVGNVKVKQDQAGGSEVAALQSIVGSVSVVGGDQNKSASRDRGTTEKKPRNCNECGEPKKGRTDKRNNKFYCYDCWAAEGVEFCKQCEDFASGHRDKAKRGERRGDFYCDACWAKYDEKSKGDNKRSNRSSSDKKSSKDEKDNGNKDEEKEKKEDDKGKEKKSNSRGRDRRSKSKTPSPTPEDAPKEAKKAEVAKE